MEIHERLSSDLSWFQQVGDADVSNKALITELRQLIDVALQEVNIAVRSYEGLKGLLHGANQARAALETTLASYDEDGQVL
jgi:hypothetical protein